MVCETTEQWGKSTPAAQKPQQGGSRNPPLQGLCPDLCLKATVDGVRHGSLGQRKGEKVGECDSPAS